MGFMETESFYLMQLKEARPEPRRPVGASDIGATRADSYMENAGWGLGPEPSILKEKLKNVSAFRHTTPPQVQVKITVPILKHRGVRGGEPFDQGWRYRRLCGN
jgi:hypothetical protein